MQHTEDRTTRPVSFINFHGLTILVVAHQGVEYVEAKSFAELACVDWKSAKRAISSGDSAVLYGTAELIPPQIRGAGGASTPQPRIFIRLDRARMYLARINTNQMRGQGNQDGAEQLLALQIEWAQVLHQYETHGLAVKAGRQSGLRDLMGLVKARALISDPRERRALTQLIHEEMRAMGLPLDAMDGAQGQLPLSESTAG